MVKKAILLMFTVNLFAAENKNCTCKTQELSTKEKVVVVGAVGTGAIIAAPYVLPASVLTAIGTAVTVIATKAAAVFASITVVGKVGLGLTGAKMARPLVLQTQEEKLNDLLKENASRPDKAKKEFISCLKSNKSNPRNASGRPDACEDAALFYAFNSSVSELNKRTQAFSGGKCFCN